MRNGARSPATESPQGIPPPSWDRAVSIGTRILVWGVLFALLYLLRSFFLLIFFTFVFAYIQTTGVRRLERLVSNRPLRVVLVATGLLLVLILAGVFLAPTVKKQTEIFFNQFSLYISRLDQELLTLSGRYPLLYDIIPGLKSDIPLPDPGRSDLKNSPTVAILQQFAGLGEGSDGLINVTQVLDTIRGASSKIASITSAFLLSLLFSFLIVLDLPKLEKSVAGLERTRLDFIYREVAGTIRDFSLVLGRALEAQLLIAIVNSILTALGITLLGLGQNAAFLSVIVFFCSFIPVAGVFLSSVPICLVALQTAGVKIMLLSIVLIAIIHFIEGYIVNPRIYGSYMRINPVIVLIILTIGGKLFHFWGLILGVPVCTYLFGHAIQYNRPKE